MSNTDSFKQNYLWLIIVIILANATGLFSPILNSNDAYFYAVISKNIAANNDWVNLFYGGKDWLDKPHLPFWVTALFFKIFGYTSFAYVLPGFLFNLLGLIYTYRLAKEFFDRNVALISAVIYASSLHLMLSAIDVRAEAFLLGEILPACFYFWRYDKENRLKHLVLASLFTGLALMTKGIFVLFTICSGQICYWIYTKQFYKVVSARFFLIILLSFIFAIPEFICLYVQFDLHPEKIVFDNTNVSGLHWYFWGSQFGRFFNTGPIVNKHGDPFFFVHTLLWAFLPWTLVFIFAIYTSIKKFNNYFSPDKAKIIYLSGAFLPTFIMFSATKFQLDHYTNIIIPFAAIFCAFIVCNAQSKLLAKFQVYLSYALLDLNIILILFCFKFSIYSLLVVIPILLIFLIIKNISRVRGISVQTIVYPALAISSVIIMIMAINGIIYQRYNAGYNISSYIENDKSLYLINTDKVVNTLGFHSSINIYSVDDITQVSKLPCYVLINKNQVQQIQHLTNIKLINSFDDIPMEKFIPTLFSDKKYEQSINHFLLFKVN